MFCSVLLLCLCCSCVSVRAVACCMCAAAWCIRECYEKDGQTLPGKKGIMLRPDQWRMLAGATDDITAALNAHNTRYALELGNM